MRQMLEIDNGGCLMQLFPELCTFVLYCTQLIDTICFTAWKTCLIDIPSC